MTSKNCANFNHENNGHLSPLLIGVSYDGIDVVLEGLVDGLFQKPHTA